MADEVVEHRSLGQLEGSGIINKGVAAIVEFHASGRHHHFVEVQAARLAHLQCSYVDVFGCLSSYRHPFPHVVITLHLGMDQIIASRPDLDSKVCLGDAIITIEEKYHLQRVGNHDRVGCQHRHLRFHEGPLQEAVFHITRQVDGLHLRRLPFLHLHGNVSPTHLHLHWQSFAESLHGVGRREPSDLGRGMQLVEPIGEDVNGVFLLAAADALQGVEQWCIAKGLCHSAAERE